MKLRYKIASGFLGLIAVAIGVLAIVIGHTTPCAESTTDTSLLSSVETMQAVRYGCYGGPEVISYETVAKPVPAGNEVLVRVQSAAVNPLDWHYLRGSPYLMRLGTGIGAPDDPRLGVDYAGIVEAVGSEVTEFVPGDQVFGGRNGAFAEYLVVPEDRGITAMPSDTSFEEAAAVPIAALTALQALRDKGRVKAGDKVLINGASGGVGTYAVQIAKALGAEVHGVCSTRNVELVRSLGADRVWDYKKDNYTESDEQYDVIVDMVGNHSLGANRGVMQDDGVFVMVGGSKGDWVAPLAGPLSAMVQAPFVSQELVVLLAQISQDDLRAVADLMAAGKVRSVIDRRYDLSQLAEAIRYSESGRARGKIIIRTAADAP
ncbi:MAG: NAD(P)-dependent alcohol dehydrogenase [Woeseiaceae bacterium]|nr:NAD(P)-dependent alcohol dehydrogenase [Woeseiaceae bacterium]